jgi:hypothetical protein
MPPARRPSSRSPSQPQPSKPRNSPPTSRSSAGGAFVPRSGLALVARQGCFLSSSGIKSSFNSFFILQQEQEQNSTIQEPTEASHTTTDNGGRLRGGNKTAIRTWEMEVHCQWRPAPASQRGRRETDNRQQATSSEEWWTQRRHHVRRPFVRIQKHAQSSWTASPDSTFSSCFSVSVNNGDGEGGGHRQERRPG